MISLCLSSVGKILFHRNIFFVANTDDLNNWNSTLLEWNQCINIDKQLFQFYKYSTANNKIL